MDSDNASEATIVPDSTIQPPDDFPQGTTVTRCTGCGATRFQIPGDRRDEWRHHFDYCPGENE